MMHLTVFIFSCPFALVCLILYSYNFFGGVGGIHVLLGKKEEYYEYIYTLNLIPTLIPGKYFELFTIISICMVCCLNI